MKYKFIILLSFLCSFMIVGCPDAAEKTDSSSKEHAGKDRSEEAGKIALRYFEAIRDDDDFKFFFNHSTKVRTHLQEKKLSTTTEFFERYKKTYFNELYDGRYSNDYGGSHGQLQGEIALLEKRLLSEETKRTLDLPIGKKTYQVFIEVIYKDIQDALLVTYRGGRVSLLKKNIFTSLVYEYEDGFFSDDENVELVWDMLEEWPDKREMQQEILRRK